VIENASIPDPLLKNASREARLILFFWLVSGVVTIAVCYFFGYLSHEPDINSTGPDLVHLLGPFTEFDRRPDTFSTPLGLGIPDWIFYGVAVPWIACIVLTFWFCLRYFTEDDLGIDHDPDSGQEL